ncbi:hypothetical protein CEXT_242601, partial [Caerostris extrusa]
LGCKLSLIPLLKGEILFLPERIGECVSRGKKAKENGKKKEMAASVGAPLGTFSLRP